MAIKAKIKATALWPLYIYFLSIFFARRQDFRAIYHPEKFQKFWISSSAQKCWWTGCCENGHLILPAFFTLSAYISHKKRNSFQKKFLIMVKVIMIYNWKSFKTAFHMENSFKFDQIQNYPGRTAAKVLYKVLTGGFISK